MLLSDYGLCGPYIGQVKAVLSQEAPGQPVIDLFSDLPAFNVRAAAYLVAAYSQIFPQGTVFLCVVDPGVGSDRDAVVLQADRHWFVGPDNGLFEHVARRSVSVAWFRIDYHLNGFQRRFTGAMSLLQLQR